jgi:hypothetical protein
MVWIVAILSHHYATDTHCQRYGVGVFEGLDHGTLISRARPKCSDHREYAGSQKKTQQPVACSSAIFRGPVIHTQIVLRSRISRVFGAEESKLSMNIIASGKCRRHQIGITDLIKDQPSPIQIFNHLVLLTRQGWSNDILEDAILVSHCKFRTLFRRQIQSHLPLKPMNNFQGKSRSESTTRPPDLHVVALVTR